MQFKEMKDLNSEGGSSKSFLRLKDGESIVGCFRGEIHEFYAKWAGKRPTPCEVDEPGASFRFRVNFIYKENGALVSKIWEQGVTVYKTLADLNNEFPLDQTWVKISRSGSSKDDTTYTVLPIKQNEITAAQERQIKEVQLLSLENKPMGAPHGPTEDADDEAIPF